MSDVERRGMDPATDSGKTSAEAARTWRAVIERPQSIKDTEDHNGPALTDVLWQGSLTKHTDAGLE